MKKILRIIINQLYQQVAVLLLWAEALAFEEMASLIWMCVNKRSETEPVHLAGESMSGVPSKTMGEAPATGLAPSTLHGPRVVYHVLLCHHNVSAPYMLKVPSLGYAAHDFHFMLQKNTNVMGCSRALTLF